MNGFSFPETSAEIAVSFRNLELRYGKTTALDDISLDIPGRKLIGLIGPDGVGKSTLLSLISGSHAMQKGSLQVLGGDMRDAAHRRGTCPRIAYMPQGLGKNLYFTLTVEENLQFFARLFGHDAAERRRRIDHLTKSTGLYPFLDRPAGKLSGGMKQKLGLCCALIHDPDLLVLDEPTTGVDPLARRQFWDLIDRIRRERQNMTVLVATAYMDEARRFDGLIAMQSGKILATGTPEELLEQTGESNLDDAFIALLPPEMRQGHKKLELSPLEASDVIAIEAENLTRRFGSFVAVDHVSFRIRQGEIFGFLGSNGCGKTTTMRMLTGLLPATEGTAKIFGTSSKANSMEMRLNLGYMTQAFSLYGELTVRQNLMLYGRLYRIAPEKLDGRVDEMLQRFHLAEVADVFPKSLPLGIKQRLSLAAAVIHKPKLLILDEPTSGVDPVARDLFWELIIELSRRDHVTIFITTHFMNEAERCDRISLMHAGRSLACDEPAKLVAQRGVSTLEEAFIDFLLEAQPETPGDVQLKNEEPLLRETPPAKRSVWDIITGRFNFSRWYSCFWRENLELMRDPIRATLALFGALLLMIVMGYGISMDVENLRYAVLDRDNTQLSTNYALNLEGSRYFIRHDPVDDYDELDERMRSGELSLVVEIPPGFGRKVERGLSPEVAVWIDGAMPLRAETINGYITMIHQEWIKHQLKMHIPDAPPLPSGNIQLRYRYNPDVRSLPAMVPAVIPILLMMIPAVLSALAVVREKEMGSIINLYVTPLTRLEFLLGKQCPYILFSMFSALLLMMIAVILFDVPVKGSYLFLLLALLLYSVVSTGFGLLASSITRSQIAVIFLTMIATILPATQLCGMITPVGAESFGAQVIAYCYPTTYMLLICRGVFSKALGFAELTRFLVPLLIMAPVVIALGTCAQKKQES